MKARAYVFIGGRVQGVFFRMEIREKAKKRNVAGWVRNTSGGRVEAIFEGEKEDIEMLIEFCKSGPPQAKVTKIDIQWKEYTGEFTSFNIRQTVNI